MGGGIEFLSHEARFYLGLDILPFFGSCCTRQDTQRVKNLLIKLDEIERLCVHESRLEKVVTSYWGNLSPIRTAQHKRAVGVSMGERYRPSR